MCAGRGASVFTIRKSFQFSAGHFLDGLPVDHPCTRQHGHNYTVILELQAPTLNDIGFVVDYRDLAPFKMFLDNILDHYNLNDIVNFNPTAENLAEYLFGIAKAQFPQVSAVIVCETDKTSAEYRP